jgi:pimeloyl-ACP methyl ester carboxylesterase
VLAAALAAAAPAAAKGTASGCGTHGLVCSTVNVPLDRSGRVPGSVALHVEDLPADRTPARGTIFLVAGGPGQGSAEAFDLGDRTSASFFRALFPGYTLVAFDNRGTGDSGVLTCPNPEALDAPTIVAGCASSIGAVRDFYATPDHVEDLEAVRQSIGVDKIAIYGVSYGTKLALAYASAQPAHVERLLLDSVVPLDRPDPFATDELTAMPSTLAEYCPLATCKGATPDFSGDVVALANALATKPLTGSVGHTVVRLGAADFLGLVFSADLSPGLGAELPAAVHAAREGVPRPLLRLDKIAKSEPDDVSLGLYLATVCHDGAFPWQPGAALTDRASGLQAAAQGLLGPFGLWAVEFGSAYTCLGWPTPAAGTSLVAQPLPDVPVLAISGGLDFRTPTAWASSVVSQFPQGHLLVVPGVGHSVLTTDPSGCAAVAVIEWLSGSTPQARCPRAKPYIATVPAYPTHLPAHLDARQTLAVAERTLQDAEAIWFLAAGSGGMSATEPGLDGGTLIASDSSFQLRNYAITPRIALSGVIRMARARAPIGFSGSVTVSGPGAAHGKLSLRDGKLVGTLRVLS